jgi:orotidine-5'-phosphate decarboxylase
VSSQPPAAAELTGYLALLDARLRSVRSALCLGIDPDPGALPAGFAADITGIERFAELLLDAAGARAAAVKVNLAFFEAFGSAGIAALERLRARVPTDLPFIADAKRGDIGNTATRQAVALFDILGAHAVTLNPYMGRDGLEPFLARRERFAYVLCRTSNTGAADFQALHVEGQPLFMAVAQRVSGWAAEGAPVGLVVGATAPAELAQVRGVAPSLPFLVPGLGAQGGDADAVLTVGPATSGSARSVRGGALLVNVSRAIAATALDAQDPAAALVAAADRWATLLQC